MGIETTTVRGSTAIHDVSVVVCFAYADLPSIRALEPDLHGDGVHVHLVPGIDRDLEGAGMYLLEEDERTVFAVAHSPALDSDRLDQLIALFGKQRARMHRLCVVEYDTAHPEEFVRAVDAAVQNMRARSSGGAGSSLSAGRSLPSGTRTSKKLRVSATVRPLPSSAATDAESSSAAASLTMSETSTAARTDEVLVPDSVRDAMIRTTPGSGESGDTFPDLGESARNVMEGRAARARAEARQRRRRILTATVATAVAAAAIVAYQVGVRRAAQRDGAASAAVVPVAPTRSSDRPHAKQPEATQAPAVPPTFGDSTRVPVEPATAAVVDAEEADAARRVRAALDSGRIHALDTLLVRRPGRHAEDTHAEASRRCSRMREADLEDWRLATLDELRALRRARMLPEGTFWSSTRRRGEAFTLSRDVTRPQPASIEDGVAGTLCVRLR
ncbi:MAG: hypothetical protein AAGA54_04535 [Myxococcota bacterium]